MTNATSINSNTVTIIDQYARKGRVSPRIIKTTPMPKALINQLVINSINVGGSISRLRGFIRVVSVPLLVFSSVIAWDFTPYFIIALVPFLFYMVVTGFLLYDPIKAIWSYFRQALTKK